VDPAKFAANCIFLLFIYLFAKRKYTHLTSREHSLFTIDYSLQNNPLNGPVSSNAGNEDGSRINDASAMP
jgi:hypothetical protein